MGQSARCKARVPHGAARDARRALGTAVQAPVHRFQPPLRCVPHCVRRLFQTGLLYEIPGIWDRLQGLAHMSGLFPHVVTSKSMKPVGGIVLLLG